MEAPVRVAIIGGGIAGLALATQLVKHSHLDVQLYEAAAQFSEIGAGISFGANAVNAIQHLNLSEEYHAIADKVAAPYTDVWFQWRNGYTDEFLSASLAENVGQSSVHRADFLDAIIARMPLENAHFSKKIQSISENDQEIILTFQDGSSASCDYLIGADGIHSNVRQYVLSSQQALPVYPKFSGTWAYRGIIKYQDYKNAIQNLQNDPEIADVPQMFLGKDKHILTFPIRQGEEINIVAFKSNRDDTQLAENTAWTQPVSKAQMLSDFSDWSDSCIALLDLIDNPTIWALHEIDELNSYQSQSGRVILIGDAAHAMLPHQGAGAGQGLEDAAVLAELFKNAQINREALPKISEIYQDLRLERACKVQRTSRESGEIYELYSGEYPDFDSIGTHLAHRFDWLWEHDLQQDFQIIQNQLAQYFQQEQSKESCAL